MKNFKYVMMSSILACSMLFSSCIGSFRLWNNLKEWNLGVGDKFVNEVVFLAFNIIPVYGVAYLADVLVLNSIEFWSGENPVALAGTSEKIVGKSGQEYILHHEKDGMSIEKENEGSVKLVNLNGEWNVEQDGRLYRISI